jgi:hypothetical protein
MHRPQPNKLHDELDALLDGRPVELTDELAPLAEAADALRSELASHELDPQVADRHLERVLGGSAMVVRMPPRPQPSGWDVRRRIVAVALAAALVLAPATVASAAALPGQAMYPFKLAIEQLRLTAVQWSPAREAGERIRIAGTRVDEVQTLLDLKMYNQLPTAIRALNQAVVAAEQAVAEAREQGEPVPAVEAQLGRVVARGFQVVRTVAAAAQKGAVGLSQDTADAIEDAVKESPAVAPQPADAPPQGGGTGTPTQSTAPAGPGQGPATSASTPPASQPSQSTATTAPPETSTSQAPTTTAPPTTTTTPPTTTTTPPTTTEDTATPGSAGVDAGGGGKGKSGEQASPKQAEQAQEQAEQAEQAPPTTTAP